MSGTLARVRIAGALVALVVTLDDELGAEYTVYLDAEQWARLTHRASLDQLLGRPVTIGPTSVTVAPTTGQSVRTGRLPF